MKKQVVVVHGGDFFDTYEEYLKDLKKLKLSKEDFLYDDEKRWKSNLLSNLGKGYEVFAPEMPNQYNAKYPEWKIHFEKILPFLHDGAALVGHSLGAIFLARYVSENKLPIRLSGLFLVAGPYLPRKQGTKETHGFSLGGKLDTIAGQADSVYIFHSTNDPYISATSARKYQVAIPDSKLIVLKNRGHFRDTHFPELVKCIKEVIG